MNVIGTLMGFLVGLLLLTLATALMIACINSWVLQDTFANGWGAAIDRWPITLGVGFLFGLLASMGNK